LPTQVRAASRGWRFKSTKAPGFPQNCGHLFQI